MFGDGIEPLLGDSRREDCRVLVVKPLEKKCRYV